MQQSKVKKTPTRGIATAIIAGLLIPVFKLAMAFDGKGVFSGRFIFIGVTAAHFAVAAKIVWERFDDQHRAGRFSAGDAADLVEKGQFLLFGTNHGPIHTR